LAITYLDPNKSVIVGITFGKNIDQFWKPLGRRFQLALIREIDTLSIKDIEHAERLFSELKTLQLQISSGAVNASECPEDMQEHFLHRIEVLLSYLEPAIENWDEITAVNTLTSGP
jgi:hypothetical protein